MEDTQTKSPEQTEQDALIVEMLRSAKGVELPSELAKNPVIHRGDGELPAPMTVTELRSGKYFWIWETDTGEKVPVLGYMLGQKLRQKLPSGKFRFTTIDPGIRPKRGEIKCMLHAEAKDRKHYDELGFRTCRKSNITNQYQLEQHMKHRHPQEWEAIDKERKDKEREEDRALQRLLIAQQLGKLEAGNKEMEAAQKPEQELKEVGKEETQTFTCMNCGKEFAYKKSCKNHTKKCK